MRRTTAGILMSAILLWPGVSQAASQEYDFESEEQREQFKQLTGEMRCPKCLNSNLAGSDAPIAQDLTGEIYRQVQEGRSSEEIVSFMKSRYGDFISYRPPLTSGTFLLWFGPLILLLGGLVIAWRIARTSRQNDTVLSDEEQQRLTEILSKEQK